MKLNDENKKVKEFNDNWFPFGVHAVKIGAIELGHTDSDQEFVEVTVLDPENPEREDTARVWFTTDEAANYSFNTLRQIYVHNAPEAAKDDARDTIDAVADTEELVKILSEKLIGKDCWFTKYYDPKRTYTAQNGDTRRSVNKNIYGYEPKLKPELMPKDTEKEELNATLNDDEKADIAKGIPKDW